MYKFSIVIHVLAACIWTGGHIALIVMYLLPALKSKDLSELLAFEKKYGPLGIPSLLVLIITGLYQAIHYLGSLSAIFDFANPLAVHVFAKLLMIVSIFALAADMKFRVMNNPPKDINIISCAWHILLVGFLSILLVIVGLSVRLQIF